MGLEIYTMSNDSTMVQGPKKRVVQNNQENFFDYGLKDVAPLNKGLGEIVTGTDLPDMGLVDVAPPNKGLAQVIMGWFK